MPGSLGEPAATQWDPELAAMRHRNVRIEEELTLDALLQDLSADGNSTPPTSSMSTGMMLA